MNKMLVAPRGETKQHARDNKAVDVSQSVVAILTRFLECNGFWTCAIDFVFIISGSWDVQDGVAQKSWTVSCGNNWLSKRLSSLPSEGSWSSGLPPSCHCGQTKWCPAECYQGAVFFFSAVLFKERTVKVTFIQLRRETIADYSSLFFFLSTLQGSSIKCQRL